jgi:hypothetical protein
VAGTRIGHRLSLSTYSRRRFSTTVGVVAYTLTN